MNYNFNGNITVNGQPLVGGSTGVISGPCDVRMIIPLMSVEE